VIFRWLLIMESSRREMAGFSFGWCALGGTLNAGADMSGLPDRWRKHDAVVCANVLGVLRQAQGLKLEDPAGVIEAMSWLPAAR
jgi:hypothetical protein